MRAETSKAARAAAAAAIAMAVLATAAQAQETNLLINGDFETPKIPDGQVEYYGATSWGGGGNIFTNNSYARTEGGQAFKTYAPYQRYGGSVGTQSTAVTPGENYRLSGYLFSPSNDFIASADDFGLLEMAFFNSANEKVSADFSRQFTNASTANQWTFLSLDAAAPADAVRAQVVIGYIQLSTAPLGAVFFDDVSLTRVVTATESNWVASGSGGWLSASNWQNGQIPNAVGAVANFGSSITAPSTVSIAGAGVTAGTVNFNNAANAYTIAGAGSLTLDVASGTAALNATAGNHSITAPLVLNDTTTATVAAGQTLTVGGPLTLANGIQLSSGGTGTLRINAASVTGSAGASVRANGGVVQADVDLGGSVDVIAAAGEVKFGASQHVRSLNVASGARASLTDVTGPITVIRTPSLTVASGGTLNLGDNAAIIEYTGTSPAADIRAGIIAGKAGAFAGAGITSTLAASDPKYSIGYAEASSITATTFAGEGGFDSTTLLVRVTLKGDADLSGNVNFADLVALAQNYNGTGKVWRQGDSDYDGTVNFADLVALAQNYNASTASLQAAGMSADFTADWALAQSLVPEPTALAAALGLVSLAGRRRARTIA